MSQLFVDNIKNRTGGAVGFPTGVVVTGVATFNNQVSIAGTLSYEDVTNVDSTGIVTAKRGVKVTGGEILVGSGFSVGQAGIVTASGIRVGTAITIDATSGIITATSFSGPFSASTGSFTGDVDIADKIIHTGDTNTAIRFPAADTFTVETAGSEALRVDSSQNIGINDSAPLAQLSIRNSSGTEGFYLTRATSSSFGDVVSTRISVDSTGPTYVGYGDGLRFSTAATGGTAAERLRITSTGGVHFNNAELIERVSIVANKLSAVPNVNLDNGMVHYYTTNETTTATPNIISTAGINTNMATGDTMSVTILSKPNNAGYFPKVSIDGVATGITTYWSGGEAPSSAESSGVDVNVYQIIKTADATYDVLANTSNFA